MTELLQDLRVGWRQLLRRPGFTAAALTSLALGIGLTTTLFSVVHAVLLREPALERPDRLVEVYSSISDDFPEMPSFYPDFQSIREGVPAFQAVAAHTFVRGVLSGSGRSQLVTGEAVSANYFDVLGIRVQQGRGFAPDEEGAAGASPVVVVSHGLWQRALAARPDVVGTTLTISGRTYTVIGLAPPSFPGTVPGLPTDFWVPVAMIEALEFNGVQASTDNDPGTTRLTRRGQRYLFVKGRLTDNATIDEAQAQLDVVFSRLREEFPATNERTRGTALAASGIRFHPMLDGYVKAASAAMLAAVALVLLVACANVASLLLARATSRRRELAVRAAIGAGRGRLIRQLLVESLLLSAIGGVLGTLVAWWAVRALGGLGTGVFPVRVDFAFAIDGSVLAFAIGLSALTAIVFGLAPAWSASRPELVPALKDAVDGQSGPRRRVTLRDALVVSQLALSLVLLVSGALLGRGLLAARSTDLGFDPAPVSALAFNLQMIGYSEDEAVAFRDRALQAVRALPGVEAAAVATRFPLAPDINMTGISVRGQHQPGDDPTPIDAVNIGADYFAVVGLPLVEGRAFTEAEVAENRNVAIVNETMARRYWPGRSAVGERLYQGDFEQEPHEIVGVVRDHKVRSVGEDPRPYVHFPATRSRAVGMLVRTTGPAEAALPRLRETILALEPEIVFTDESTATEVAATTMAPTRMGAMALAGFGGVALLLAAMGLYGVIAYAVSLRTREVGIRMAIGAERGQVVRMILAQGGRLAIVGVALGALGAAAVGRLLEGMLYGVSGLDPIAFAAAAGVLLLVAMLANLGPALTASRVNPVKALRAD
ncbi:MAG: ABC transporter permease [Vicinamibacteria bacterium]